MRYLEEVRPMIPLQGRGALGVIAVEEQVAREEREQRPDLAPARCPALVDDLGQIMGRVSDDPGR
jgi:hypothetical protein